MAATNTNVGTQNIFVLNDNYQYVADNAAQETSSLWLDTKNVMSVKRDKTIYAIRAKHNYSFVNDKDNSQWFAAVQGDANMGNGNDAAFRSNIYRGFGTVLDGSAENILGTGKDGEFVNRGCNVYGNLSVNGNASQLGVAGSLNETNFAYVSELDGNINVSSNVNVWGNASTLKDIGTGLSGKGFLWNEWTGTGTGRRIVTAAAGTANIDANIGSLALNYIDNAGSKWNRVINANLNGNVFVTGSTDPCDLVGAAIPLNPSATAGDAVSNEAYRHQFTLQKNGSTNRASLNPAYMVRVSRFGKSLSNASGTVADSLRIHSFTGNFFAALPFDNTVYGNGNVLTSVAITGNVKATQLNVFNSNVFDGNLGNLDGVIAPYSADDITKYVTVAQNGSSLSGDFISNATTNGIVGANGNLSETGVFTEGDRLNVLQSNIVLDKGVLLFDRLTVDGAPNYVQPFQHFATQNTMSVVDPADIAGNTLATKPENYWIDSNIANSSGLYEMNSKYIVLQGENILANNWTEQSLMTPSSTPFPDVTGVTPSQYNAGDRIDLWMRRGTMSVDNITYVANQANPSGRLVTQIPQFLSGLVEPAQLKMIDGNLTSGGSLGAEGNDRQNIATLIGNTTAAQQANIAPTVNFLFAGNVVETERVELASNVVTVNANSFMGNTLWNYDRNGAAKSSPIVDNEVHIVYGDLNPVAIPGGSVRPLSLNSTLAEQNLNYNISFPSYTGKTNASQLPTATTVGFMANITANGWTPNAVAASTGDATFALTNNSAVQNLMLNGVAYSEFEFSNYSHKFTDVGNVCGLVSGTNYKYEAINYSRGNANLGSNDVQSLGDDAFINTLVDYNFFANLAGNTQDIHRLTVSDIQYRYYVGRVLSQVGVLDNSPKIAGSAANYATDIYVDQGDLTSAVKGNLQAPNFVSYMYENVSENSTSDVFYPFYNVADSAELTGGNVNANDTQYYFPGFIYKNTSGSYQFFNYKGDADADFVVNNNGASDADTNFNIMACDTINGTVKIAKEGDSVAKTIPLRPIRLGKQQGASEKDWFSYIVCKVSGESQSYVTLLFKLNSTGTDLHTSYKPYLPVAVSLRAMAKQNNQNVVQYNATLRVFDATSDALQNTYNYTRSGIRSQMSLFSYNSPVGSSNTTVGVNMYSIPTSNTVATFSYKQSVISKLLSYSRVDYRITGMSGYEAISNAANGLLFARSNPNNTSSPTGDSQYPTLSQIAANSTRFYLDQGLGNGLYVDILNSSVLTNTQLSGFRVDRSVEWVLKRGPVGGSQVVVGRGLLTSNPDSASVDSYITENNEALESSGFYMKSTGRLSDIAAILLAQQSQTGPLQNNTELSLTTKSDVIAIDVFINGTDQTKRQNFNLASSLNLDLSALYGGSLPSMSFNKIRGFSNLVSPAVNNYLWKLAVRPDTYSLVWQKQVVTTADKILFSANTKVEWSTMVLNLSDITMLQAYLDVTAPALSDATFANIGYFIHNGLGQVKYQIRDFTSNYGNQLQQATLDDSDFVFGDASLDAFKVAMPTSGWSTALIKQDGNRFYVTIQDVLGKVEKLWFLGNNSSLPVGFSGKTTALLYTGRRPIVNHTLEMASSQTLTTIRDAAVAAGNKQIFNTLGKGATKLGAKSPLRNHYVQMALTNSNGSGSINIRSLSYTPQANFFQDPTGLASIVNQYRNFYGTYVDLSQLFENPKLSVKTATYEKEYTIQTNLLVPSYDPSISSLAIRQNAFNQSAPTYTTFQVSATGLSNVFQMCLKSLPAAQNGFRVEVDKAGVEVYEILDMNDNGEVDINKSANFGLNSSFSELVYQLSSSNTNSMRIPKVVASWTGDNAFHALPEAAFNIKMNTQWSVGYNLDAFFTIRHQDVGTFEVLTIETEAQTQAGGQTSSALIVRDAKDMRIAQVDDWASAIAASSAPYSGLTFKLRNGTTNMAANEIVRLFVDNTIAQNTLQWNVSCTDQQANKAYKLYSYDQEAYARLLDEQVRVNNNFA